jgi:hypothetical protein
MCLRQNLFGLNPVLAQTLQLKLKKTMHKRAIDPCSSLHPAPALPDFISKGKCKGGANILLFVCQLLKENCGRKD